MRTELITLVMFAVALCGCVTPQHSRNATIDLEPGDLLFQDLNCGPLCDAIEAVTEGVDGRDFSHVGMITSLSGPEPLIIEAIGAGVVETPLSQFLARSASSNGRVKVCVGRLEASYRELIPGAIECARRFLGLPYDRIYEIRSDAFYCSELIYEAFRQANGGVAVFDLAPMTFKDPATQRFFPAWLEYYEELGVPIPEGEPGLNPGGMSRSPRIRIVGCYGG